MSDLGSSDSRRDQIATTGRHGLARVSWERQGDLMRTQLQETGRIRLSFITLADLAAVVGDLGIEPSEVGFYRGYAVVGDAWKDIPHGD